MSTDPSNKSGGFFHIAIPLDASGTCASDDDTVTVRQVSESEAAELIKLFRDVGRNQPCPCGSGRKFKRCCLLGAH